MKQACKQILAMVLCIALLIPGMPVSAEGGTTPVGCTHTHDDTCAYIEGADCAHLCGEDCADGCVHTEHDGECGYIEAVPCDHEHDENCGDRSPADSPSQQLPEPGDETGTVIVSFATPTQAATVALGTSYGDLPLPERVEATLEDAATPTDIPVDWTDDDSYNGDTPGDYGFTAVPLGYSLADGVSAPVFTVTVLEGEVEQIVVASFDELPEEVATQGYDPGEVQSQDELNLLATLAGLDEKDNPLTIPGVTWECTAIVSDPEAATVAFDPDTANIYEFTAVLPEGYVAVEGVALPVITVVIRGGVMLLASTTINIVGSQDVTTIQNNIQGAINNAGGGNTVTVTGSKSDADNTLTLNIPTGVTVKWQAAYAAIEGWGSSVLIELTGTGTFEVVDGAAINGRECMAVGSRTASATLIISGGEVSNTTSDLTYPVIELGNNSQPSTLIVRGNGRVRAENGRAAQIFANCIAEVTDNAEVSASNYAFYGSNGSHITVSGNAKVLSTREISYTINTSGSVTVMDNAEVSAITGSAITCIGVDSIVTVSGGTVKNAATYASRSVIDMYDTTNSNTGVNVVVSGTGKVVCAGRVAAIDSCGSVKISDSAFVASMNRTSYAVGAIYTVEVSGGVVFSRSSKVINCDPSYTGATGTGVVIGFDKKPDGTEYVYTEGSTQDIIVSPETATAVWSMVDDGSIYYENGANSGYIPLDDVAVNMGALPVITIEAHPQNASVTEDDISGTLDVTASVTEGATLKYQWYQATGADGSGGSLISGATAASFPVPTDLTSTNSPYYFYVLVSATGGAVSERSNVVAVTVAANLQNTADVEAAKNALTWETIKGSNTLQSQVSFNLTLPTSGANGAGISWASTNTAFVAANGTVTCPSSDQGAQAVTLTATITKGSASDTKTFLLTVVANPQDTADVEAAKSALTWETIKGSNTLQSQVSFNLALPTSGANGAGISWASTNTAFVAANGTVTCPSSDQGAQAVTLTATITKGSASDTKTFSLTVVPKIRLTANDFTYSLPDYPYDGDPHGVEISSITPPVDFTAETGGTLSIYYRWEIGGGDYDTSTVAPTNADDEYMVYINTTGGTIYEAASNLLLGRYRINPKPITENDIASIGSISKTYDGSLEATAAITFKSSLFVGSDNVTAMVYVLFDDADVGNNKPVTLEGSFGFSGTGADNYQFAEDIALPALTGSITPAAYTDATPNLDKNVRTGTADTQTINLSALHPTVTGSLGTVTYEYVSTGTDTPGIINGTPGVAGDTLTVATNNINTGTNGSVVINVLLKTQNYGNIPATVTLTLTDKTDVSGDIAFAAGSAAYTGSAFSHEAAAISGITAGPNPGWTYTYAIATDGTQTGNEQLVGGKPVNAGSYAVTAAYEDDDNIGSKTVSFTVNAKSVTVTAGTYTVTKAYDENTGAGTCSGSLTVNGIILSDSGVSVTATPRAYSGSNAGDYTVTVDLSLTGTGSGNYTLTSSSVNVPGTITKAPAPTITWPTADSVGYGDALSTSTLSGGSTEYGSFAWTNGSILPSVGNSGYSVTFTPSAATAKNYETITTTTQNIPITVGKKDISGATVNITGTYPYTGSAITPPAANVAVTVNGSTLANTTDYTYSVTNGGTDVGTATVTVTGKGNYTGTQTGTFEIGRKAPVLTDLDYTPPSSLNHTYTGSAQGIGTVQAQGSVNGLGAVTVKYSGGDAAPVNAGSYTITAVIAAGANYSAATLQLGTYAIAPLPVTITPNGSQSKPYGASDTALTFTPSPALFGGDSFTGSLARAAGEDVGSYAINLGTLGAGGNYTLSLASGTVNFAITKATAQSITSTVNDVTITAFEARNAATAGAVVDLANLPATVTVATDGGTATLPITWATGDSYNAKGTTYAVTGTLVGDANVDANGLTYPGVTVTVTPITAANPTFSDTLVVQGANTAATASDLGANILPDAGNITVQGVSVAYTVSWNGDQTIDLTGIGNAETFTGVVAYTSPPAWLTLPGVLSVSRNVTVTDKTQATISANITSKGYTGAAYSHGAATVNNASVAASDLVWTWESTDGGSYSSTAQAPTDAGDYKVTIAVRSNHPSCFGSVEYTFTITKAQITIKADDKTAAVGDAEPSYTYTPSGLVSGETLATAPTLTSNANMSVAGTYTITPSGAAVPATGNYETAITYVNGALTVKASTPDPTYYTISVSASPCGGGTVSGGGSVAEGSSHTVAAAANNGYTFQNWTENGAVISGSASYTFVVSGNRSLVANFTATSPGPNPNPNPNPGNDSSSGSDSDSGASSGDRSDGSYTHRELTHSASGVKVSGYFSPGATLIVNENTLHTEASGCEACAEIRAQRGEGNVLVLYDISISGGYRNGVEVSINVGNEYNGQTLTVLHCLNRKLESKTLTVKNGYATGTFATLSPFGVLKPGAEDALITDVNAENPEIGGDGSNPQTGDFDASPYVWLWLLIPAAALTVFTGGVIWKRKRRTAPEAEADASAEE